MPYGLTPFVGADPGVVAGLDSYVPPSDMGVGMLDQQPGTSGDLPGGIPMLTPEPPAANPYQGMQDFSTGSGEPASTAFLSPDQETAYGEYISQHGAQAVVKLEELSKAAKFRRALAMMTQAFATVAGRPDIAAFAHQTVVAEDQARAQAVEAQILGRVGLASIEREQRAEKAKGALLGQRLDATSRSQELRMMAQANQQAVQQVKYLQPNEQGQTVDPTTLATAIFQANTGDPSALQAIYSEYKMDHLQWEADKARSSTIGAYGGEGGDLRARVAAAGAQGRADVIPSPAATQSDIDVAARKREAEARATKRVEAENQKPSGGVTGDVIADASKIRDMSAKARNAALKTARDELSQMQADFAAGGTKYTREGLQKTLAYIDQLKAAGAR